MKEALILYMRCEGCMMKVVLFVLTQCFSIRCVYWRFVAARSWAFLEDFLLFQNNKIYVSQGNFGSAVECAKTEAVKGTVQRLLVGMVHLSATVRFLWLLNLQEMSVVLEGK